MRLRSWFAVIVLALIAAFFVLNWRAFAAPEKLNLLVTSVDAPMGVVMLVLFAVVILVLSIYLGSWQATLLMEFRRQAKELEAQRALAESAEASRFTELGALMRGEIAGLRAELKETENSIAAHFGELDDRLQRQLEHR